VRAKRFLKDRIEADESCVCDAPFRARAVLQACDAAPIFVAQPLENGGPVRLVDSRAVNVSEETRQTLVGTHWERIAAWLANSRAMRLSCNSLPGLPEQILKMS
jgi:hypothetical protein